MRAPTQFYSDAAGGQVELRAIPLVHQQFERARHPTRDFVDDTGPQRSPEYPASFVAYHMVPTLLHCPVDRIYVSVVLD